MHRSVDAGDALDDHAGLWTWPIPFAALAAVGFVRQRVLALRQLPAARAFASLPLTDGLAAFSTLDGSQRRVAAAERVPPLLFHAPLVLNWIALGIRYRSLTLPTCVNPTIPAGGMWGESKSNRLLAVADAQQKYVADFVVLKRRTGPATLTYDLDQACTLLATAGLHYPVVAKPDVGWHGFGVRLIADTAWLGGYLARFPAGAKLMLQRYVPYAGEAAVLYARRPGEANGRILSVTLRYFPHVVGDGQSTLRDLIRCDARARWKQRLHLGLDPMHHGPGDRELGRVPAPGEIVRIALIGSQRVGALYRDARHCLTPLEQRFDAVARSMREFHYGRFDVRFESIEKLMDGEDFAIVEINGIGGEAIDAWDPDLSIGELYRRFAAQQRMLFLLGALNRERGFAPESTADVIGGLLRQIDLIRRYPASS